MIRATGRYQQQTLQLDLPIAIEEGARVVVEITPAEEPAGVDADWSDAGMSRLEDDWGNAEDAVYDNWRSLYDVPAR